MLQTMKTLQSLWDEEEKKEEEEKEEEKKEEEEKEEERMYLSLNFFHTVLTHSWIDD